MRFTAYVNASCHEDTPLAQGGFGVLIFADDHPVATASVPLCHCDGKPHTKNRTELCAALFVMHFIHDYAFYNSFQHCCNTALSKHERLRISGEEISLRVLSESDFVASGFNGEPMRLADREMWDYVMKLANCAKKIMSIDFQRTPIHEADPLNVAAGRFGKRATHAPNPENWREIECKLCEKYDNLYRCNTPRELAVHMRTTHFKLEEPEVLQGGSRDCELCARQLLSYRAFLQHMHDRHKINLHINKGRVMHVS